MTGTIMGSVHPGEILLEVSQYHLAKAIDVPARRVHEIVHGHRRISADTALRLARFFGTSERFWIKLAVVPRPGGGKGPAGQRIENPSTGRARLAADIGPAPRIHLGPAERHHRLRPHGDQVWGRQ